MMSLKDPWNIAFFVTWLVYFGIRHHYIKRTAGEKKIDSRMDGLERGLLLAMVPGIMLLPLLYLFTPLVNFANYGLLVYLRLAGTVLLVFSLWLFWRSHADLGQNWSVSLEIRENHDLVTKGVYQKIRHPMYASIWLWGLGQGLVLENWLAGWSVLPVFALMYFIRIPKEEGMMREKFGAQYEEYMTKTGRVLPRFGK